MNSQEYLKVYENLKLRILNRDYAAGQKIPTEMQFCQQYHVSRITVRHALRLLEKDGLLERFQGRGTFVRAMKPAKLPITEMGFAKSVKKYAPGLSRVLLNSELIHAPADICRFLRLEGEKCFIAIRQDILNQEGIAFDRAYIRLEHCRSITEEVLVEIDFFERWQESEKITLAFYEEIIESIAADCQTASILNIQEGTAVLKSSEVYYDTNDKAIAVFESYYRGDKVKLTSTISLNGKKYV
ncbi:MAG: GntR family transcriptional regulator [Planctomycetaceae bacterium]|nr:GntR family transcriptional regulator [Planctomycetaceae bacterium]